MGFLRYWTFSNIPLFLLAVPSLVLLLYSGIEAFALHDIGVEKGRYNGTMKRRLAVPQVVRLALLLC